jgi:hypothetical protein
MPLQRGRSAIESPLPEISNIRAIERADLAHLSAKRPPNQLQSLTDNHHRIARALASGMSVTDAATTCGMSINRISVLRSDPAFADLIAHYRAIITAEWAEEDTVIQFLRGNAVKAQAMIADKLDKAADEGEFLPTRDLLGIAELGLDRTGYGKVNKNLNVNIDFAAKLDAARSRLATTTAKRSSRSEPKLINPSPPLSPVGLARPQPSDGSTPAFKSPAHPTPSFRRI